MPPPIDGINLPSRVPAGHALLMRATIVAERQDINTKGWIAMQRSDSVSFGCSCTEISFALPPRHDGGRRRACGGVAQEPVAPSRGGDDV